MASVKGSDNPFPKVLLQEVATNGSDTATPAADFRNLFLGEDGALHLKDSAAAVTDVGGDLAAHLADTTAAHAASAIGFTPNGSIAATDVQAAIQEVRDEATGGGGLTYVENALTTPVTMVAANTFYDGPAVVLSAGTWLIMATVTGSLPGAASNVSLKIWDGTTVGASCQATGNSGWSWRVNAQCVVVIASGTPTWKASVAVDSITGTDGTIFDGLSLNGSGDNASIITAVKIA